MNNVPREAGGMRFPLAPPVLWCLAAAALFGASTPASKLLLDSFSPFTLAGLLYLGAAGAVLPWALRDGLPPGVRHGRNLLMLSGAVLFGGILGPVFMLWGLSRSPAASTAIWLNLETPATAMLAWLFFREHLGGRGWIAAGLIFGGSLLLASPSGFSAGWGALLVLLACVFWGLDNNLTALIDGFTPAQSTLAKGTVAGLMNLGLGASFEGFHPEATHLAMALGVGALGYGASLVLYVTGAQQLGAARSQMVFSTAPGWGVLCAWLFLKEEVTLVQGLAAILIAGALWLLWREHHHHVHHHEATRHVHWHRHDDAHHGHRHSGLPGWMWHCHVHEHADQVHAHAHRPDLHHRHDHRD